ncbi:peptidyl-prolyl cis-trans isomerase [Leuconostocaceae bacterium ESL0723]|nr:peptidyl-prolyl cis-trans isomerase [Leuconostocaceae bacterium ESL0723]
MRKFAWPALILVFVAGLVYLYFNSSKTLMSSNAGKITEKEYYDDVKKSSAGQQEFANMAINKVLNAKYGNQVSKADSDKAFETQKAQYGSQFNEVLAQNNMTADEFKTQLRNKMVMSAAIKDNYKITQKQVDDAYADYQPDTTISLITAKDSDSAQSAIDDLGAGSSWSSVYKKYNTGTDKDSGKDGQLPAFDSTSTSVDSQVQKAAAQMSVGATSDSPVQGANGKYYVIKLDKVASKPSESKVESRLKDKIASDFMNNSKNSDAIQKIIGGILRKADISIKDNDLKNALSGYLTSGVSSSSSKK